VGSEEVDAVTRVVESGQLSGFIGEWCDEFDGGTEIQAFEAAWRERFGVRHAISVNSNTSGLMAAMGAIGLSPGDEVIVPPTTMSATAMAPLIYGGIPVFVDIEPETFCLDPEQVLRAITPQTRAILVVDLFGHPGQLAALREIADARGIYLIEDAAQAPLAHENGKFAGTVGHIGVFSLNYHKHIHTGEGGVCVTDDDDLALRLRAIRNHGENIVEPLGIESPVNLVGFNFRMTEMSAAIGREQLKKLDNSVAGREARAEQLSAVTQACAGLTPPSTRADCRHVYYVWAARYDESETGISRRRIARALVAEGVPIHEGYVKPLYQLPLFQKRLAIGRDGFPFNLTNRSYEAGLCPVAERMYESDLLEFPICSYALPADDMNAIGAAILKVFENIDQLADLDDDAS
jgi:dTDP-4-amino-4,6-dideoxygalactose transaminase